MHEGAPNLAYYFYNCHKRGHTVTPKLNWHIAFSILKLPKAGDLSGCFFLERLLPRRLKQLLGFVDLARGLEQFR